MATIKLTVTVEKLDNVLTLFDVMKVYRAPVLVGPYAEITAPGTRIPLLTGQTVYTYDDVAGDPAFYYKTSYFHSITLLESSLSDPIQGEADALYVSIQDVRDEGVPASVSDARILQSIQTWQAYVERLCRQWFVPRQLTWDLDGSGTTLLQLPVPIISITALYLNGLNGVWDAAQDPSRYVVYSGRGEAGRDDRKNPRVKLVSAETSIFEGVGPVQRNSFTFLVGEKNQRLVGTFGFIEPDGSTPAPIKYAVRKLAVRGLAPLYSSSGSAGPAGPVIEEETDRHRKKWSDAAVTSKSWSTSGTGDAELDAILAAYKGPLLMRAPRTMFRRLSGRSVQ
jgi:hypothetical protein